MIKGKENDIMVQLLQKHAHKKNYVDIRYKWVLLHRGSEDGFDRDIINKRCKDKSTVICIQTTDGNIFGIVPKKHYLFTLRSTDGYGPRIHGCIVLR